MQEQRELIVGDFYKHFKDKLYQIREIAIHSESRERMVVYQAMYGDFQIYVRPYDMFMSEVDHIKYPDVKQRYRFERVDIHNGNIEETQTNTIPLKKASSSMSNSILDKIDHFNANQKSKTSHFEEENNDNLEGSINPGLLMFLDAENYQEKLNVLTLLRNKLDDRLINDIAISMDLTVEEGPIDKRYDSLRSGLLAHLKYECNRLR